MVCASFMLDNATDIAKETMVSDIIICYLLCAISIYFTFGMIYFVVSHGGHLMPLL